MKRPYSTIPWFLILLMAILHIQAGPCAYAASATLAWDPSPSPDVAGYRLYIGSETGVYPHNVDVGPKTTYTLSNLIPNKTYYFYATAYNSAGVESDPSEEVVYTVPATAPPLHHRLVAGLGAFAQDGGWAEAVGPDYLHDAWLRVDWPEYNMAGGETRVARGDIDGDGKDEIIIGLGPVSENSAMPGGMFEILDDDYSHLAWGQVQWPDYNALNGETWPACGDVDGDGKHEIIVGLGRDGYGKIEVFDYSSGKAVHKRWAEVQWSDYNAAQGETRPATGDIDGDGKDEIVIGLGPVSGGSLSPDGMFEVLDHDFTHLAWGQVDWADYNALNGETWPATGDLNGDGRDEIIVGLGQGGEGGIETLAFQDAGVAHGAWLELNWPDYNSAFGETRPACGDIDSDKRDEIVIGLGKGGGAVMQVFDDAVSDNIFLASLKVGPEGYDLANGETWPAVIMLNGPVRINPMPWLKILLLDS